MNKPIRHGEVVLRPVRSIPQGATKTLDEYVAADSDAGHHHILYSKHMELTSINDDVYVNIKEAGTIIHKKEFDRHPDLPVAVGKYKINKKTEYRVFDKVIANVQD